MMRAPFAAIGAIGVLCLLYADIRNSSVLKSLAANSVATSFSSINLYPNSTDKHTIDGLQQKVEEQARMIEELQAQVELKSEESSSVFSARDMSADNTLGTDLDDARELELQQTTKTYLRSDINSEALNVVQEQQENDVIQVGETKASTVDTHTEADFHQYRYNRIAQLVNETNVIRWAGCNGKLCHFLNQFQYYNMDNGQAGEIKDVPEHYKIFYHRKRWGICLMAQKFQRYYNQTGSKSRPHILFTSLDENFGGLSSGVHRRTQVKKGSLANEWKKYGCTQKQVMDYIFHKDTIAIFTTQYQHYAIPKVISIPLGLAPLGQGGNKHFVTAVHDHKPTNRTQLLMINNGAGGARKQTFKDLNRNFNGTLKNTYKNYHDSDCPQPDNAPFCYSREMSFSKFIPIMSGQGLDCYRLWESLYMGIIPVVERLRRTADGWMQGLLADLPIAWIDRLADLTPEYLEREYQRIVLDTPLDAWRFEKLTTQYWFNLPHKLLREHNRTGTVRFPVPKVTLTRPDDPVRYTTSPDHVQATYEIDYR